MQEPSLPTIEPHASIGLDLGGTTFTVGWLDTSGTLHDQATFDTRSHRPCDEIVADLARAINVTAQKVTSTGLGVSSSGIGFPGVINPWKGTVLLPPNFGDGWNGFALAHAISEMTGLQTYLVNDARAFTFAEARVGAGAGSKHLLGITLGTGVGGGLVLDGQLYLGSRGTAGEFGHQIVQPHGLDCGCGGRGCIETIASGPALVSSAVRPFLQGRTPILREITAGKLEAITPKTVCDAAREGDPDCQEIIDRAALALAHGITNIAVTLGVEVVVIGGGVALAGDVLFDPIRTHLSTLCKMIEHHPEIRPAKLEEPGVVGAAVWAREQVGVKS